MSSFGIRVAEGPRVRGVFATQDFAEGALIEIAPVYVFPVEDTINQVTSAFDWYLFRWGESCAVVFGYGSLYNHSYRPNAFYKRNFEKAELHYVALRPIAAGEEITINYNGEPHSTEDVGFEVVES